MSFAAPWFLAAGALAALGVLAAHFLARQEPLHWALPTARFVPESREQAPSRSLVLRDRVLLLLRVAAVLLPALGFARPSLRVARRPLLRVILADVSRAVADSAEVAGAVRDLTGDGDRVLRFEGSVSAGLIRGIALARQLRGAADSVSLILLSPLAREELDAATLAVRRTWPGGITWRPVRAADSVPLAGVLLRAAPDDPLRATLGLAGFAERDDAPVRLVRTAAVPAADSAWARDSGHLLLHWPVEPGGGRDTSGAVVTARSVLVAAFPRPAVEPAGTAVAWWADGRVAASERVSGAGCVRRVAIPLDAAGDLALLPRTQALLRDLLAPCGGSRDLRPADSVLVRALLGHTPAAVATTALPPLPDAGRAALPWLLGLALLVLLAEQWARRPRTAA